MRHDIGHSTVRLFAFVSGLRNLKIHSRILNQFLFFFVFLHMIRRVFMVASEAILKILYSFSFKVISSHQRAGGRRRRQVAHCELHVCASFGLLLRRTHLRRYTSDRGYALGPCHVSWLRIQGIFTCTPSFSIGSHVGFCNC